MKKTANRLKGIVFKGGYKIPWAERAALEWAKDPAVAKLVEKTKFAKFNGDAHASPKKADPYHAAAVFRKKDDFKGSGVSIHVYPDGWVVPSKSNFPARQVTPAKPEELGENSKWLDESYVEDWKKEVSQGGSHPEAGGGGSGSGYYQNEMGGWSRMEGGVEWHLHPDSGKEYMIHDETKYYYRVDVQGIEIHLHPEHQVEYYYHGSQVIWLN